MLIKTMQTIGLAFAALSLSNFGNPASAQTATSAKVSGNWLSTIKPTADGGFVMGNPNAKVSLMEYGSLACSHCAHFHAEGITPLKQKYIATGKVRYEFRNFILNGPDFAVSLIARCQGASRFFPLADAFFTRQSQWIEPFTKISDAQGKALSALPPEKQIQGLAVAGGLESFTRKLGIPKATFDKCLTDQGKIAELAGMRKVAIEKFKVEGTPTFYLNGKKLDKVATWPDVEKALKAALN